MKIDHTDSKEYLVKGFEYYNDEKYAQAIEKYALINRNDTNYNIAIAEIAICQFRMEKYDEAIETNKKAIEHALVLAPDMFINLGNSFDL
ncbi:MAG: hypothetical protein H7X71_06350, partial [Chitinophagales bacterium]|nr:hypothetical protein [Chitinophagales bacterium]